MFYVFGISPHGKVLLRVYRNIFPFLLCTPTRKLKSNNKITFCDFSLWNDSLSDHLFSWQINYFTGRNTGCVTFCRLNWSKDHFHVLKPPCTSWSLWFHSLTFTMLITFLVLNLSCSSSPNIFASEVLKMGSFSFQPVFKILHDLAVKKKKKKTSWQHSDFLTCFVQQVLLME